MAGSREIAGETAIADYPRLYGINHDGVMAAIKERMDSGRVPDVRRALPRPHRLLNVTIGGSHLYGFPDRDSDIDYRGCYLVCAEGLAGLRDDMEYRKPIHFSHSADGQVIYEADLMDVAKYATLALKGNCNVIEELAAPSVYADPAFEPLRRALLADMGRKGVYDSFRGLAYSNYMKYTKQGKKSVKKYLYIMRGLLHGMHILDTGRVQPNVEKLNEHFRLDEVSFLIQKKRAGETDVRSILMIRKIEDCIDALFERIDRSYAASALNEHPLLETEQAVNDIIVGLRLGR